MCSTDTELTPISHWRLEELLCRQCCSSLKGLKISRNTPLFLSRFVCTSMRLLLCSASPLSHLVFQLHFSLHQKSFCLSGCSGFIGKWALKLKGKKHASRHLYCSACSFIYGAGILHLLSRPSHSQCFSTLWHNFLLEKYDVLFS